MKTSTLSMTARNEAALEMLLASAVRLMSEYPHHPSVALAQEIVQVLEEVARDSRHVSPGFTGPVQFLAAEWKAICAAAREAAPSAVSSFVEVPA